MNENQTMHESSHGKPEGVMDGVCQLEYLVGRHTLGFDRTAIASYVERVAAVCRFGTFRRGKSFDSVDTLEC